ncbi:chloride channel protein [candidate division WOR-3 bacterium]|nr:chloride channel protein [candidate division WOR-3 bacterium]
MKKITVNLKLIKRKLTGKKSRSKTSKYVGMNIMAAITGIVCGIIAVCFRFLVNVFTDLFQVKINASLNSFYPFHIIFLPALGGILSGLLVYFFAKEAKGHGIPQVMEAFEMFGGKIRKRIVAVKALSSAVTIGSGGSAGREGPIVQMGAGIGSAFGQFFKLNVYQTRILLSCGVAGAVSATFDTPVGGVLFAIELIIREFKTKSFVPIVISSVFASLTSKLFLSLIGQKPELIFTLPPYNIVSNWEFLFYIILGLICGGIAFLYVKSVYLSEDVFGKMNFSEFLKPAVGGLFTGIIGAILLVKTGHLLVFGNGYDTINLLMNARLSLFVVASLVFLKIAATSFTIGSGGSGGVFAPSLVIGAMAGGSLGIVLNQVFPSITASFQAYAIVGMAAVFAGMSRATMTAIIMVFEMTGNYNIIMPLMLSCVISDIVAIVTLKGSIYTIKLKRRGVNIEHDMEVNALETVTVEEVMKIDVVTVNEDSSIEDVEKLIIETGYGKFPVVKDNRVTGIITEKEMASVKENKSLKVSDIMRREIIEIYPDDTLEDVLTKNEFRASPLYIVVSRDEGAKFEGILTRSDIFSAYREKKRSLFKKNF